MKHSVRKPNNADDDADDNIRDIEILKAVAQAWHAQTGNPKPTMEFDSQKGCTNFRPRPTRFKQEAMNIATRESVSSSARWDFSESLLDSYEIVTLSKKLEANLSFDQPASSQSGRAGKRRRGEGRHILKSLFSKASSKRVDNVETN